MKFQQYLNENLPSGFVGFDIDTSSSNIKDLDKLNANRNSIIKIKSQKFKVFRVNGDYSFSVTKEGTKGKKYYELVSANMDDDVYEVWELTGGGMKRKGSKPIVTGKAKVI